MKKSLILLLFWTIPSLASAQFIIGNPSWKWDTITTFDAANNLYERYSQTCDVNGNILQQLVETYNAGNWQNYYRTVISYEQGIAISSIASVWTGGSWRDVTRITPTYDTDKRIVTELIETYGLLGWTYNKRRNYSYDAYGRKYQMLQETWKTSEWLNDMLNTYEYDIQGHLYRIITQFSDDGSPWENGMRLTYTTDDNGYYLLCNIDSFESGLWQLVGKITYTNDPNGNILTEVMSEADGVMFTDQVRLTYTYDKYNNCITGKSEEWTGSSWEPTEASEYVYYRQDYLIVFLNEAYHWQASYKYFPLGLNEVTPTAYRIYPNPASGKLAVDCPANGNRPQNIMIYNLSGSLVKSVPAESFPAIIDISDIPSGTYLLRGKDTRREYSGKVILIQPTNCTNIQPPKP